MRKLREFVISVHNWTWKQNYVFARSQCISGRAFLRSEVYNYSNVNFGTPEGNRGLSLRYQILLQQKVTEFGTNRRLIYDFLLVINSNLPPSCTVSEYSLGKVQNRYIWLPLLCLTPPTEGFPWDDLGKILRRSSQGNFSVLRVKHKRGSQI